MGWVDAHHRAAELETDQRKCPKWVMCVEAAEDAPWNTPVHEVILKRFLSGLVYTCWPVAPCPARLTRVGVPAAPGALNPVPLYTPLTQPSDLCGLGTKIVIYTPTQHTSHRHPSPSGHLAQAGMRSMR